MKDSNKESPSNGKSIKTNKLYRINNKNVIFNLIVTAHYNKNYLRFIFCSINFLQIIHKFPGIELQSSKIMLVLFRKWRLDLPNEVYFKPKV